MNVRIVFLGIVLTMMTSHIFGQVTGIWRTIDDKTGEPKSHVEIYEKNGAYFGRVVKLLPAATTRTCDGCPGDMDGKSLLEVDIIQNMKKTGDYYSGGTIIDPAGGKEYRCKLTVEGNKLYVRGYIGIPLLGRTQTWERIE